LRERFQFHRHKRDAVDKQVHVRPDGIASALHAELVGGDEAVVLDIAEVDEAHEDALRLLSLLARDGEPLPPDEQLVELLVGLHEVAAIVCEVALVTGVEAINDGFYHTGIGEIVERPVHIVVQKSSPAERKIEATVSGLNIVGREVVPVAVDLTRRNLADCFE